MDNNISTKFQIEQYNSNERFQFSSINPCQQPTIQKEEVQLKSSKDGSDLNIRIIEYSQHCKSSITFGVDDENANEDENPNDDRKKKIMHRDIERQRRQEMATLYGSLRSLLPLEYLKGNRSTSDHISQTVSYIKHQEERVQKLSCKRDELKKLSNSSSSPSSSLERLENGKRDALTVKPCWVGVEVIIDTAMNKGFPLSRVLQVLIEERLSIVSCISTKVSKRMFHIIKSEVSDGKSIDIAELQQKLTNSIIQSAN